MTRATISAMAQIIPAKAAAEANVLSSYLPTFAMKMSPACVADLETLANVENKNKPAWSRAVKQAASILDYRRNMLKEFSK